VTPQDATFTIRKQNSLGAIAPTVQLRLCVSSSETHPYRRSVHPPQLPLMIKSAYLRWGTTRNLNRLPETPVPPIFPHLERPHAHSCKMAAASLCAQNNSVPQCRASKR